MTTDENGWMAVFFADLQPHHFAALNVSNSVRRPFNSHSLWLGSWSVSKVGGGLELAETVSEGSDLGCLKF